VKVSVGVAIFAMFMCFFPLWMGLSRTTTNPGMEGHFHFHFIFYQLFNFFGVFAGT
jgi:hypothetical protein